MSTSRIFDFLSRIRKWATLLARLVCVEYLHGMNLPLNSRNVLRGAMVGVGMIFDETYRPFFENAQQTPLVDRRFGLCEVVLKAIASRTGERAEAFRKLAAAQVATVSGDAAKGGVSAWPIPGERLDEFRSYCGPRAIEEMLQEPLDFVCVATPDQRHMEAAQAALRAGKHVLIEKPSVLRLSELDQLQDLAIQNERLVRVVYHKLFDPDHKKLRTFVAEDRKSTRLNSSHIPLSRMPSSA